MSSIPYRRILLKLSGEVLMGERPFGIDHSACLHVAASVRRLTCLGIEVAIVLGGGNIFRGVHLGAMGIPRTPADQMGMIATFLNGIALQQALIQQEVPCCLMSALECPKVAEPFHWARALDQLKNKQVMIFVGGTGNPYFTTDTAAALRASEMEVDLFLKATKVNGIYNKDPKIHPDAVKYPAISYNQLLAEKLQVMDATAVVLCRNNCIPIFVFNMQQLLEENLEEALLNPVYGSWVMENTEFL